MLASLAIDGTCAFACGAGMASAASAEIVPRASNGRRSLCRARRLAMHAAARLIDLIEHHHAVARAGLMDRLDDIARQRADISAAMAADLSFVTDTAEADAHEFALHGQSIGQARSCRCWCISRLADRPRSGLWLVISRRRQRLTQHVPVDQARIGGAPRGRCLSPHPTLARDVDRRLISINLHKALRQLKPGRRR
jgi:hypothetical protein